MLKMQHVSRLANEVAHLLAKYALGSKMICAPVSSKGYCLRIKYSSGCMYSVAYVHVSILSVHVPIFKCSACWSCTSFSSFLVSECPGLFKRP